MSKLEYNQKQELQFDGVRLLDLVHPESHPEESPLYVYSAQGLQTRLDFFKSVLSKSLKQSYSIHYAIKANAHIGILNLFREQGLGIDVVSGGEMKNALDVGFRPEQVIFSGAGKTKDEIRQGLQAGIRQFNVESPSELKRISDLAKEQKKMAVVVLRINPGVDPKTHPYIATGFKENKFGIDESSLPECLTEIRNRPELQLRGLSSHIGSQLLDLSVMTEAFGKMRKIFEELRAQGFALESLDVGGGLGLDYRQSEDRDSAVIESYGRVLSESLKGLEAHIQFEPGRVLVARAGVLLTQIQYIKKTPHRNFVICNSGMHHLIRPALYQAFHRIFPLIQRSGENLTADVVGPVCESSDFFGKDRSFQGLQEGDWLCVAEAGAYGASMASLYNAFPLPKEILLK
ncbi:MAG: diaminopimelate decarboxylase [Bdellovibrio sp. CG10_big_fil_rev_8_21_14_0_10_47_8]|nr:MAG: diaminopimelate decarboxylase [Bdellovibrio sp. CG10_big_fil_rev_8_21_14_0_10_47_8]